jgi:EcsC family protein
MTEILDPAPELADAQIEAEIQRLAQQYRSASGVGLNLLNMLGGQAENLLDRLPSPVRSGLDGATHQALTLAMQAASQSRKAVPDQPTWVNTAVGTAMGAAGGFAGLPGALVELPVTTALLLRSIQGVALDLGFDPDADSVKFDCIRVFAAAGPLEQDDGADLGFVSLRLSLSGGAMQKLIATVAPKLSIALGQKLAAQAVPVLGAATGAGVNYVYLGYYQRVAGVHFGLRKLAIDADLPHDTLVRRLQMRVKATSVDSTSDT